ncbi:hypothetical protein K227x_12110 [Rubripirellula lacrimiformis]|uniref:Uncharacterized protein n=1 Tax=Rubripirellula lacrimiformis TaxID=1930273 RepID=A0A517N6S4_9BACT|nr:hypothetical protein [Rubripirellula lacrimiformis]QDT02832.1 hypothetical protein K227x_12110 [Rubripirellula lacrimiformis]
MSADTRTRRFPERTIRQVRLDCTRGLIRARFCPDRSEVIQLRCIDDRLESDDAFGNQLWYFEGVGVDSRDHRHNVYGVVEYSLQFGLHELVEDGVFETEHQRERFRHLYEQEVDRPSWRHPAHRWLAAGLIAVTSVWLAFLLVRNFAA